ncbi:MAG: Gfo/Idh/MocA family oxidoreductase [Candidatus Nezhaarchaeota archaeon]|nr:Gfo/Idh/MocA family oxidoreductase [Candidatus Nezhaarchaeota archaeon]
MKGVLRVSVIGVGFWGRNHARVFSEMSGVTLESVYDLKRDAAQGVAEKYNCRVAESLGDALENSDAATICTPSSTHFEVAMEAINAGKPILVEKPLTTSSEDALRLLRKAEEKKLLLMVGHIERYNMGFKKLYEIARSGKLGELLSIRSKRLSLGSSRISDIGVIHDLAIHDLDLSMFLAGSKPLHVYSIVDLKGSSHEERAHLMLNMDNGVCVYIEASWRTKRKIRIMEVTGSEGTAELDFLSQEVIVKLSGEEFRLRDPWIEPLKLELENFVNAVKGLEAPMVTGIDGYRALICAEAALKAAREGRPVAVSFEV